MTAFVWTFELCTISPLVMGGANINEQDEAAELRVPSIRGALRSWYRVLAGASEEAVQRELELFGGAGNGQGQGLLSLALSSPPLRGNEPWDGESPDVGLKYLSYSLTLGGNQRRYIKPDSVSNAVAAKATQRPGSNQHDPSNGPQRFTLRCVFPRGLPDNNDRHADWLLASLWLMTHLGAVGTRARRGFGSLGVVSWPTQATSLTGASLEDWQLPELPYVTDQDSFEEAAAKLKRGLRWIGDDLLRAQARDKPTPRSPHYFWDSECKSVLWLGQSGRGWKNWNDALNAIGRELMNFRTSSQDGLEGSVVQRLAAGSRLADAPWRAAFGLPLTYHHKGQNYELSPEVDADDSDNESEKIRSRRMPSPLWIRLLHCQGRYGVALSYTVLARGQARWRADVHRADSYDA